MEIPCLMDFTAHPNRCHKISKSLCSHYKSQLHRGVSPPAYRHNCRIVSKNGHLRIATTNVPQKRELYLVDFFTTLMDAKWGWVFLTFCSAFVTSWLFFGTTWWLIVWLRQKLGSDRICVENVNSWATAFLFSVETQTTIGYGGRQVR